MGLISIFFHDPLSFIVLAVSLLYSIIAHEVAHGWVAYLFGDTTAKRSGRLSLNPMPHIDPLGALMLFLVGFGWAKPVPVNYYNLRNFRAGIICVSLAGCLINILIAIIAVFLLQFQGISSHHFFGDMLLIIARINIILGSFNLIPLPPLDGSKILMGFLPVSAQKSFVRLEPYGFVILAVLLFTGLLNPVIDFMQNIVYSLIGLLFAYIR